MATSSRAKRIAGTTRLRAITRRACGGSLLIGSDGGRKGGMQHKSDTELCKLPIPAIDAGSCARGKEAACLHPRRFPFNYRATQVEA
jgi:hypothetical protein